MRLLLQTLGWLAGRLPLGVARGFGRGIGRLLGACSRRKSEIRQRIMDSLAVEAAEADRVMRGMYANLGMMIVELLRLPHMSEEELRREIQFVGVERLERCGHAYVAAVGHTGNWEWMAAAATPVLGHELNIVVKSLKPASLNRWITEARSRWGTRVHDRRGSVRELMRVLKAGKPLGFIMDQNAKRHWGIFVDFFGRPACTTDGLAQLAAISGKPVFPVFCRRDPESLSLIVEIGEEIPGPADRSPEEIHRVTAACTEKLEAFIRRYPDQWIWMHRRWRTQPEEG